MRPDVFKQTVGQLFGRLGLGEPHFDASGGVRLRIEMVAIDLVDDDRGSQGSLRIEGLAGVLPVDPREKAEAVHEILRVNAGLLIDSRAGTYVKPRADGRDMLCVEAWHSYSSDDMDTLVGRIEDVVRRIEIHRAALAGGGSARAAPPPSHSLQPGLEQALIFRP